MIQETLTERDRQRLNDFRAGYRHHRDVVMEEEKLYDDIAEGQMLSGFEMHMNGKNLNAKEYPDAA